MPNIATSFCLSNGDITLPDGTYTFDLHADQSGVLYAIGFDNNGTVEWVCQDESEACTFVADGQSPLYIILYTQDGADVDGCEIRPMLEEGTSSRVWISPLQDDHDITNDFNYGWFSIGNLYDDRENVVMASIPCEITLRYRQIWKDTL